MLTVGIAVSTAIFSVVYDVLIRTLPFPDPKRLVELIQTDIQTRSEVQFSIADCKKYADESETFSSLACYRQSTFTLVDHGVSERVYGSLVTDRFFATLGVHSFIGREFRNSDLEGGLIISKALWARRFNQDRNIVGRVVNLDGKPAPIVGIMAADFAFPNNRADLWSLLTSHSDVVRGIPTFHFLTALGRLAPGISLSQANSRVKALSIHLRDKREDLNNVVANCLPLSERLGQDLKSSLLVLQVAVFLMFSIACTNTAILQVGMLSQRATEFAIKRALGATGRRIGIGLFFETTAICLAAGLLGFGLGRLCSRILLNIYPWALPEVFKSNANASVFGFSLGLAFFSSLVSFCFCIYHLKDDNLADKLKTANRGTIGLNESRNKRLLVIAQISLTTILLLGAISLIRSFVRLESVNPGFSTDRLLTVSTRFAHDRYPDLTLINNLRNVIASQFRSQPHVRMVGFTSHLPLVSGFIDSFSVVGSNWANSSEKTLIAKSAVDPAYFKIMGIPLKSGREFNAFDTKESQPVAIISESVAKKYWPHGNPLGRSIKDGTVGDPEARLLTVVGVVGDVHAFGLDTPPPFALFVPFDQVPPYYEGQLGRPTTFVLRADASAAALAPNVSEVLRRIDPGLTPDIAVFERIVYESIAEPRVRMWVVFSFAAGSLLITMLGIYGVISMIAVQRTKEMGIRLALGATPLQISTLVLKDSAQLVGFGLISGTLLWIPFAGLLRGILYGVEPLNGLIISAVVLLIAVTAIIAIGLPVLRAFRIQPISALRQS